MPKVMMISGLPTLHGGGVGATHRTVPMAGAYRPPMGRLVGHANLGAVQFVPGMTRAVVTPTDMRRMTRMPMLRGGLGGVGLGDIDMCTDPGWVFANNALAAAGAAMTAAAGTGDDRDAGWAGAGTAATTAQTTWQRTCQQVAQQRAQAAAAAAGDPTEADALRQQLALERARREAEGEAFMRFSSTSAPPPAAPAASGVPEWVWYAGAAAGLLGIGYVVFGKKGRRRR